MKKLKHILIIDDDTASKYLIEEVLTEMNVADQLTFSSNGLEAIALLKTLSEDSAEKNKQNNPFPELILLDIRMPVMDGFEFLEAFEKIKPTTKPIPIYLLTSSAEEKDVHKSLNFNIAGYITKPFTAQDLLCLSLSMED